MSKEAKPRVRVWGLKGKAAQILSAAILAGSGVSVLIRSWPGVQAVFSVWESFHPWVQGAIGALCIPGIVLFLTNLYLRRRDAKGVDPSALMKAESAIVEYAWLLNVERNWSRLIDGASFTGFRTFRERAMSLRHDQADEWVALIRDMLEQDARFVSAFRAATTGERGLSLTPGDRHDLQVLAHHYNTNVIAPMRLAVIELRRCALEPAWIEHKEPLLL